MSDVIHNGFAAPLVSLAFMEPVTFPTLSNLPFKTINSLSFEVALKWVQLDKCSSSRALLRLAL